SSFPVMAGIPKAGRPQEPTGTSRGGIACSTATMQDPWQWFPASDSVTGSPAPSTIDVGERPSPIFTPAGRHRRDIRDFVAVFPRMGSFKEAEAGSRREPATGGERQRLLQQWGLQSAPAGWVRP